MRSSYEGKPCGWLQINPKNELNLYYYCEDLDSVDSFCVLKLFYVEELKQ